MNEVKAKAGAVTTMPATRKSRSCSECDCSWNLPPNFQEVKNGATELLVFCLHVGARVQLTDGIYPRLVSIVRGSQGLCGSGARWWTPAVEPVQIGGVPSTKRQHSSEYYKPKLAAHPSRPPREPYKLREKT